MRPADTIGPEEGEALNAEEILFELLEIWIDSKIALATAPYGDKLQRRSLAARVAKARKELRSVWIREE